MPNLEPLAASAPEIRNLQFKAEGCALWFVWKDEENPLVARTLEEYGGVHVVQGERQALWFFFSIENATFALARLVVWARFNPADLFVEVFPSTINVGDNCHKQLVIPEALKKQSVDSTGQLQVWVHPTVSQIMATILGISLIKEPNRVEGMSSIEWELMSADSRLPYESSMGWFVILRPVGSPLDKAFQTGWREFFAHIEALLQRYKFRFTIKDYFLMFPVEGGVRRLREWCKDFLLMVDRVKKEIPEQYWPCVMGIVDRKGLHFNDELPTAAGLDWQQLAPDFPYMTLCNALMLGDEFTFQGVRFAPQRHLPDDWCSLSLSDISNEKEDSIPHLVTEMSLGSHSYCFYCGQRSHEPKDCPTRAMAPRDPELWKKIAFLDFTTMGESVDSLNTVYLEKGVDGLKDLAKKNSPEGFLLQGFFDLVWPFQLRAVGKFWQAKDKDLKQFIPRKNTDEQAIIWGALDEFRLNLIEEQENKLSGLTIRFPKAFEIMSLRGFDAMERGDFPKAIAFWKEAEMASPYPVVAAWHLLLQARCLEMQSQYGQAIINYDQIYRQCPSWSFVVYRKIVCQIKSGFPGLALPNLLQLIDKDGNFFNQALFDSELERGSIQVFNALNLLWRDMQEQAKLETINLEKLLHDLPNWFIPGHQFSLTTAERIKTLLQMGTISNYVTYQTVVKGRVRVDREIQRFVGDEGRVLRDSFKNNAGRLQHIKDEAAWFPFPNSLKEFNRQFNECVLSLNWVLRANLHLPDAFKKAQVLAKKQEERLAYLEKKMRFLRIIRDSTLFTLSMAETFFWIEIIGIIAIFVLLPLIIVYGDKVGLAWTSTIVVTKQFYVQKTLFFLVSILAIGISALRTVVQFDRIKERVFAKARKNKKK